jgi:hypothetical protein
MDFISVIAQMGFTGGRLPQMAEPVPMLRGRISLAMAWAVWTAGESGDVHS